MKKLPKSKKRKPVKIKAYLNKWNIVIALLAVTVLVQFFQVQQLSGNFSFLQGRDSSLIMEVGQIRDTYGQFGQDLNEIRQYLRLPTESYALEENQPTPEEEENLQTALFDYVSYLGKEEQLQEDVSQKEQFLIELNDSEQFEDFLKDENLEISEFTNADTATILRIGDKENTLLKLYLSKSEGVLYFKTPLNKEELEIDDFEAFQKDLMDFIDDEKDDLMEKVEEIDQTKQQIEQTLENATKLSVYKEKKLRIDLNYGQNGNQIIYNIYNKLDDLVGQVVFDTEDLKITLIDSSQEGVKIIVKDLEAALEPYLAKLDSRTPAERKSAEILEEFEKTLEDRGFQLLLDQNNLHIQGEALEDDEAFYYYIYDDEDNAMAQILIEKATGVVYVANPDGSKRENLLFLDLDASKKKL